MKEPTQRQMIVDTLSEVRTVKTVLLGVPGTDDTGIVGEVKNNRKEISRVKRILFILIGSLVGSGAIGSGIYTLLNGS